MRARTAPGSIGIRAIEPRSRPCAQLTSRPAHAPPHTTRSPIHIDVRRAESPSKTMGDSEATMPTSSTAGLNATVSMLSSRWRCLTDRRLATACHGTHELYVLPALAVDSYLTGPTRRCRA